jgi:hypothetical protein
MSPASSLDSPTGSYSYTALQLGDVSSLPSGSFGSNGSANILVTGPVDQSDVKDPLAKLL